MCFLAERAADACMMSKDIFVPASLPGLANATLGRLVPASVIFYNQSISFRPSVRRAELRNLIAFNC